MDEAEGAKVAILATIERMLSLLAKLLLIVGTLALVLMAGHVISDVVGRLFFNHPVYGTTEIVSFYYMVGAVCLPLAYMELRDEHITVDVFYQKMPRMMRRVVFIFSILMTALFFGLFAYQSWFDSLRAMSSREIVMGASLIEIWPSRFFMPISFGLLVLACLLRVAKVILTPDLAESHIQARAK
ncbi:MAG: TRAP transporter small permease [Alphaproteobacteria bacterium]|nr:TRAP transporter small permease [Alphaproteobacteria bacterium]